VVKVKGLGAALLLCSESAQHGANLAQPPAATYQFNHQTTVTTTKKTIKFIIHNNSNNSNNNKIYQYNNIK